MVKVHSIVRKIYGRSPTDGLNDLDGNTAVWCIFMNVTLQASFHLGQDFLENLRFAKNQLLKSVKQLFQMTEKLIEYQKEINNLTTILLCNNFFEITDAKTHVFTNSMLCQGSMSDQPVEAWKNKIEWYLENRCLKDLKRIDGEPMEFEVKIFTGFTTLCFLEEIQTFMTEITV